MDVMVHFGPMDPQDTIVAVSSPPGRGLRGLVRLNGPGAYEILRSLTHSTTDPTRTTRRLTPARLRLDDRSNLELPVLLACFAAPASYTGQDMVEVQCPGHPALLERLLDLFRGRGARLAEPGEFTFRAFLSGKLDLMQAEGVAATIAAVSDGQLRAATVLREGLLGKAAERMVDQLAAALALVEAGIDFTDQEDVVAIAPRALAERLNTTLEELEALHRHSRPWMSLDALPSVVLAGAPNAGKSTLFNALLGRERAVTSHLPGATRDVLVEPLTLPGEDSAVEVLLTDLAGLDEPRQVLDRFAQQAARAAIEQADVILHIREVGTTAAPPIDAPASATVIDVVTKIDAARPGADAGMPVSAMTGQGLDDLRRAIRTAVAGRGASLSADVLALQPRHEHALKDAAEAVRRALSLVRAQRSDQLRQPELIAQAMRQALDALAALGGRMSPDDVLGRIFATFCIGK
ncbi:MAG: 50S ribosome-binding GTPase [Phycisphaeraceae bacterium]|nr:50S ribosome-binding GTPase [Phycisphaeraceae bacterium]